MEKKIHKPRDNESCTASSEHFRFCEMYPVSPTNPVSLRYILLLITYILRLRFAISSIISGILADIL
jgi:hypothetical protein